MGYKYASYRDDSKQLERLREVVLHKEKLEELMNARAAEFELHRASLKDKIKNLENELKNETENNADYECIVPANGVLILNRAVADTEAS